jgi:ketosteroid isomerase-like protein
MPDGTELPPTGKTVEIPWVSILAVRDGNVASERDYFDQAAFMGQVGLMPGT